ncbi:MAG: hypothetical protein J6J75_04715, partial [Alistipes sp.]|nr:hypothetical protein [Alistipes sp.]
QQKPSSEDFSSLLFCSSVSDMRSGSPALPENDLKVLRVFKDFKVIKDFKDPNISPSMHSCSPMLK